MIAVHTLCTVRALAVARKVAMTVILIMAMAVSVIMECSECSVKMRTPGATASMVTIGTLTDMMIEIAAMIGLGVGVAVTRRASMRRTGDATFELEKRIAIEEIVAESTEESVMIVTVMSAEGVRIAAHGAKSATKVEIAWRE